MKAILLSILFLALLSCHKSDPEPIQEPAEKYFNPIDLPKLSIDSVDMPTGFFMNEERMARPGTLSNEKIYEFWRRDTETNKLVQLEESKSEINPPIGASSFQIWFRNNSLGGKDKIEIDKAICTSEDEMLKTVNLFTANMYSAVFVESDVPFAGEKSWVSKNARPTDNSFAVMFCKHNVFIRLYISMNEKDASELKPITEELAKRIVDNIDSFAVDK